MDILIDVINRSLNFHGLKVKSIKAKGRKDGTNRSIEVRFEDIKYPIKIYVNPDFCHYSTTLPVFALGVNQDHPEYKDRHTLARFLFKRFWVFLKQADIAFKNLARDGLTYDKVMDVICEAYNLQFGDEAEETLTTPIDMIKRHNLDVNSGKYPSAFEIPLKGGYIYKWKPVNELNEKCKIII